MAAFFDQLLTSGKVVLTLVAIWLIGSAMIFNFGPIQKLESLAESRDAIFFDMNADYDNDTAVIAIENFQQDGRKLYQQYASFDLLFMLLQLIGVGALFWYATSKFNWTRGWFRHIGWFVPVFTLFDFAEYFAVGAALNSHPNTSASTLQMMRQITSLKLMCIPVLGVLVLFCVVLIVMSALRSPGLRSSSLRSSSLRSSSLRGSDPSGEDHTHNEQ